MNHEPDIDSTRPSLCDRPHATRAALRAATASLLLIASACSSSGSSTASDPATSTSTPVTAPAPSTTTPSSEPATTTAPSTTAAAAQNDALQSLITGILETHYAADDFVGARIALLDADGTVTAAEVGTSTDDPAGAPVDPDVAWNIGSVTKTFVAVVVLQLAEEGRIDLDAGIEPYLPDLADADRITPRDLLQHTSGLGEYKNDPAVLADAQREWTPSELIAVAEKAGRQGEPGGPHRYSNTNYIVLGEIIEAVTGHSWSDEVRTRIVEPLGMTNTSLITTEQPVGYQLVNGAFIDTTLMTNPSIGGAAGALQSTGHDLLIFAKALLDGTLLTRASSAAMTTFVPGDDYSDFGIRHSYGLGIEEYANDTITIIGHMGTGDAQSAFLGYDPQHDTAVAVMTNTATPGPQAIMALETLVGAGQTELPRV